MLNVLTILAAISLLMAAVPAYFYARNRSVFCPADSRSTGNLPPVSVLIPARNEAANIEDCIDSVLAAASAGSPRLAPTAQGAVTPLEPKALASGGPPDDSEFQLEILALDDASEDDTAAIVTRLAAADPRVRLIRGVGLPAGWNGKQHACQRLAEAATHDSLLWIDADVRLEPGSLPRMLTELNRTDIDLLSGFPRQVTVTWLERLLLPLIHFVLLGFLSLRAMRTNPDVGFAAGCGQLFLTRRDAYQKAGGHAAIRASRHDGVTLPRAYRKAGLKTDLFDATDAARCRMYDGARAVWGGLAKNATEGVATPVLLLPVSLVLFIGHVLPLPLAIAGWWIGQPLALGVSLVALALSLTPRVDAAARFQQPLDGALAHPLGVLLFLLIQWEAFFRDLIGKPVAWRGRSAARAP